MAEREKPVPGGDLMKTGLPYGAAEIVANRSNGKRPADMVLVSLIGKLPESQPVIVAKPGRAYDWRFLVGLDALIVADSTTAKGDVRSVLSALLALPTSYLGLWLADRQSGFNVAWGGLRARSGGLLRHISRSDAIASGLAGLGVRS